MSVFSYNTTQALPCRACGNGFRDLDHIVLFENFRFHLRCFKCQGCGKQFNDPSEPKGVRNLPYCEGACFDKASEILCEGCKKPFVPGDQIMSVRQLGSKKFHVGCFNCSKCGAAITQSYRINKDKQVLCTSCAGVRRHNFKKTW
mmetsp:Transcript_19925/g.22164  ORF Transcript_19925/g.22164 Transcript_19925/m.22164 type:complete len:145 (-) Transcript_19925:159-593(-)